jgi:hypothetical protein
MKCAIAARLAAIEARKLPRPELAPFDASTEPTKGLKAQLTSIDDVGMVMVNTPDGKWQLRPMAEWVNGQPVSAMESIAQRRRPAVRAGHDGASAVEVARQAVGRAGAVDQECRLRALCRAGAGPTARSARTSAARRSARPGRTPPRGHNRSGCATPMSWAGTRFAPMLPAGIVVPGRSASRGHPHRPSDTGERTHALLQVR